MRALARRLLATDAEDDLMVWVKLDDEFFDHPKNRAVGKDGRELLVASLCHANRHGTDGLIADHDLPLLAAKAEVRPKPTARLLVEHQRWHRAGHDCSSCPPCPDGHYLIHDYEEFQAEAMGQRERRRELSAKRSAAGRKGAASRWGGDGNGPSVANGDAMANGQQPHGTAMAPSPYLESQSSEQHQQANPQPVDDGVPEAAWTEYARLKRATSNQQVRNITSYDARTITNARTELGEQASRWWRDFDISPTELAAGLVDGTAGRYWQRRPVAS